MLTGLLVFVATLAFASAQCGFEGTVYNHETSNVTVYFGAAVGDWVPGIQYESFTGERQAWFITIREADNTRWELREWGSVGLAGACLDVIGQYRVLFEDDCSTVSFAVIHDDCIARSQFWGNDTTLNLVEVEDGVCTADVGTLGETDEAPQLSGEQVTIYPADGNLVVVSVGDYAALFQQWELQEGVEPSEGTEGTDDEWWVTDYLSIPDGYACEERWIGVYKSIETEDEDDCASRTCGVSDPCAARAGLFHNVAFNGFDGEECETDVDVIEWPNSGCSQGNTWALTPYECVDQFNGDQCIFCRGVAGGLDVKLCIERNGGTCNDIFRSVPAQGWCNLEFECPASTLSLSVITVFSVLLALFFF
jgi:hypothetical protein